MSGHPVQLDVRFPTRIARIHVVTRLALLLALGAVGTSTVYWALYLAIPAVVALAVAQRGPTGYLSEYEPRVLRVLRWFAAAYGFLWLLTDVLPTSEGNPVDLRIDVSGEPTVTSALLRLLTSLPALLLLAVLSAAGGLLWIVAAAAVLVRERVPHGIARFMTAVLRFQFRLLAYHLSLVDRYPSLQDATVVHATA